MLVLRLKKLVLLICFLSLFISSAFALPPVLNDYQTFASGNWNALGTWSRWDGFAWINPAPSLPQTTSGVITILSGHTVTVTASVIGVNSPDQLGIANGGSIIVNSGITFTVASTGANPDLGIAFGGTLTNNGIVILGASSVTTNSGTIINSGTITPSGTSFTHLAGSFYKHNFSSLAAVPGVIPASIWNATSTCEILACGNTGVGPTGLSQAFGHFIWNNTSQPSDISLLGTLSTPTTGNFTLSNTGGFNLILVSTAAGGATTIGGSFFLNNGNITVIKVNALNKTNLLSVTTNYTQNGGSMTIANCSGTLGGNTGNGTFTVGGTSTISAGTLNVCSSSWVGPGGNGTYTATGLITLSAPAIINGCSSSALVSSGSTGLITANAGITISGGTLNLNSSTTTGTGGTSILAASGLVTLSGGAINMASGAAAPSTGCYSTINAGAGFTISGGTLNLSSSLTTTGGGNGIINVSAGAFSHTAGAISKTGLNSGTINLTGSTAQTIRSIGFTPGDIITFNISQNTAAGGACTIPTGFTVAAGTTLNINDNSLNLNDLTLGVAMTNNGIVNVNASAELDMGIFVMSGTGDFSTFTDATLITKHATGISATAGLGCVQVTGTKSFASDGNYTYNGTSAQVTGDGLPNSLNGGILNIANTLPPASGGVTLSRATTIFEGVGVTGMLLFGGATNGLLITTPGTLLTIGDDVTISPLGGTASKFVDGPIKKVGDDPFIFPTGDIYTANTPIAGTITAKWARIEISAPTNISDEFTAQYFKINDPCNVAQVVSTTNDPGINHVSYKEYWELTRTSIAAVTPNVKLYWATGSVSTSLGSAISSILPADLHVAECIASIWTDKGAGATTGVAAGPGTILSNIATTFTTGTAMPFTFMTPSGVNPLPIELLSFNGTPTTNGNQLDWSTASEQNNDFFDLERSINGIEFIKIGTIDGSGNTSSLKNYEYLDANSLEGMNYYRLKQVDFNGEYSYSNTIAIDRSIIENIAVQVFPNPSNDIVNIISSEDISSLLIYNMLGEVVYSNTSKQKNIQFNPLSKGIYVIKAISKEGIENNTRFIKN